MIEDAEVPQLLGILIQMVARSVVPSEQIIKVIGATRSASKLVRAYNLCDGSRTQSDIGKAVGLDPGNFSRTVARWQAAGLLYALRKGGKEVLLHLYPVREIPADTSVSKEGGVETNYGN